ncbi:MAG: FAD-dependent oxidoreductase [Kofleriaceae bacterium]|nr:FAD-dependent oxidoreductase [Kofleriaceae bacterium]
MNIIVAGGGIFGVTAALALRGRGHAITLVDPGLPHPLAESTDISKVVRMDYGADADYTALGEEALAGWRQWNARWSLFRDSAASARPLFHETGATFLSRVPMSGFELDSYAMLTSRGHQLERLDADAIAARFPAYRRGALVDGYFNPEGGWAESGGVVAQLGREAEGLGVTIRAAHISQIVDDGALLDDGELVRADLVVVTAGSWVPLLVPELAPVLRAVGQPVFHLRPDDPSLFEAHHFPVFGADISRTGFYGFPVNRDGIVKIANHGTGTLLPPDAPASARVVTEAQENALREMLRATFPALAAAPIVYRRLCVYCDTVDGHFWIARHPTRENLVVATGGSGHAFKFAPVLGELIAAIALGEPHPLAHKFRWRAELTEPQGVEAARHHGR